MKYLVGFVAGTVAGLAAARTVAHFDLARKGKQLLNDSRRWLQKHVENLSFKLWTGDGMVVGKEDEISR